MRKNYIWRTWSEFDYRSIYCKNLYYICTSKYAIRSTSTLWRVYSDWTRNRAKKTMSTLYFLLYSTWNAQSCASGTVRSHFCMLHVSICVMFSQPVEMKSNSEQFSRIFSIALRRSWHRRALSILVNSITIIDTYQRFDHHAWVF